MLVPRTEKKRAQASTSQQRARVENDHTLHRPLGDGEHAMRTAPRRSGTRLAIGTRLADDDLVVVDELVRRDLKVERRRALADAAGGVIM